MAEYGASVETTASPEQVWRIWSDMSTWGDWNPNVSTMNWSGGFVQGSRGGMNTKAGPHQPMTLAEGRPGRFFALETTVVRLTRFRFSCRGEAGVGGGAPISALVEVKGLRGPCVLGMT